VSTDPKDRWHDLGAFIREQRGSARLSLRRLSELAGISNPYLSQIERGLRRPSAEILQQIAKALRISAETLYVQAGILEPPEASPDLTRAIMVDPGISEEHKQALVRIYLSFRREYDEEHAAPSPEAQSSEAQSSEAQSSEHGPTVGSPVANPAPAEDPASDAPSVDPSTRSSATPAARAAVTPAPAEGSRDETSGRQATQPSATAST
jgi:transcriptional regulator with XRE-family HTH domain